MQYNGKYLNPYDVLGLPWASDVELVKATYKSLVKIYHPDIFKGDKDFAKERLAQLNSAYEFLSESSRKKDFDESLESEENDQEEEDFDPFNNSNEFDEGIRILKENWDFACDYHPELNAIYTDLRTVSRDSAFAFMAFVVETKKYAEAKIIAETLEDSFLTAKFSNDANVKKVAKLAIQQREIKFAKELNRALKILGPQSSEVILVKLSEQFPNFAHAAYSKLGLENILPTHIQTEMKIRMEEDRIKAARQKYQDKLKKKNRIKANGPGKPVLIILCLIIAFLIFLSLGNN